MTDHVDFGGSVFHGPVIGKAEQHQHQHGHYYGSAPTALQALPAGPPAFTGREPELRTLLTALDPTATTHLTALSGLGGIGKTALALEAAHQACARGWFPGGTLFVDLHGYDDTPVTADLALQALLRALGVPPVHLPGTAEERGALYRSVLAGIARDRGPVLLLADNASFAGQVRPLLPGCPGHRVLTTSRHRLPTLGARLLSVAELPPDASLDLLDRALRAADPDDVRITDDPASAARLSDLCGHLPLALQIASALLSEDPARPVHELVGELNVCHSRVDHLNDGERNVRAAFELSYRRLPEAEARLLRLLALMPGTESGLDAVTALQCGDGPGTSRLLTALERAHLVERGGRRGRWRLHDLVREYACGEASGDERQVGRGRVLAHYLQRAVAADAQVRPACPSPTAGPFRDREEALAWLDEERTNLVAAATQWAVEPDLACGAIDLAAALGEYLQWRRYFDDAVSVGRAAQGAAHDAKDLGREADAWNRTGVALRGSGRLREAFDAGRRALALYDALGHDGGKGMALSNMAAVLGDVGDVDAAVDGFHRALALFRATMDRHGEAGAWNNLALTLRKALRMEEALDALRRALDLYRETGDRPREGRAWHNYGVALNAAGKPGEAVAACLNGLEICEEFEDWHGAGQAHHALALVHDTTGEPLRARTHWLRAADAYERAGSTRDAAHARRAARITAPSPSGTAAPAAPPSRTAGSGPPVRHPPGAPDTGEP
ncbi:tetratricopeptide repeat protein [Streptomyces sp. NPDC058755]|uniref:tetratricopeptide repeat protein n=1 Tax=Streptomyces sp. NPDC058755 TaxID=3346624 RepID=UPI003686FA8F